MSQVQAKDFLTLYCVRHGQDKMLALVVAENGSDAVQVCVEDGLEWAHKNTQVTRIHKRVAEERGVIDVIEVAGGGGNGHNCTRLFVAGVQAEGNNKL